MRQIGNLRYGGVLRTVFVLLMLFALRVGGAEVDLSRLPPSAPKTIDFSRDIKPILDQSCIKCHGPEKPKSKFRLDNRASALKGGENQATDIVPGDSAKSALIHYVAGLDPETKMPPPGKGEPLSREQIALLRAWIDQGVAWETNPPPPDVEVTVVPTVGWSTVHGNEHVFREQYWTKEGWNGGAEHFEHAQRLDDRSKLILDGHALRDDYRVGLTLDRTDVGFVHSGWQQYRKYFSDSGGFYQAFTNSPFSLNRDLHLDIGRFWVDFGLTLPDWPRMVLGYEYQYEQGGKSILQWGPVVQGVELNGDPRARDIFPAAKDIDERAHVVKFDLDHEVGGLRIEESARVELYDLATSRTNRAFNVNGGAITGRDIREGYHHVQGANTFRVEKQITDWLFGSAGYLYSKLSADASFSLNEINVGSVVQNLQQWRSQEIILDRQSHVANGNLLFLPWEGFTVSTGVLTEWTRQSGFGDELLTVVIPNILSLDLNPVSRSDLDTSSFEERVDLRYTRIPFTALFAEARLQQQSVGQFEEQVTAGPLSLNDFRRDTEASSDLKEFRAGFNTSPWSRVSFTAHYRHFEKDNHYNHVEDTTPGYSAFIRSLSRSSDEVETKLVLGAATWLKLSPGVKWVTTYYHTATDRLPGITASGDTRLLAGTYSALIPRINVSMTPSRRLYLSSTFSYQDSRTATFVNDNPSVVPYRGHVYNLLSSGTFVWTEKTDLRVSYAFSHADYGENYFPINVNGLPLGEKYQRHWVQAGLTRRFLKNITGRMQYGFSLFDEPSSGHFNDYRAHLIFASMSMNWPFVEEARNTRK